jgi:hypothetical protein
MASIESLRNEYKELTALERAVMTTLAIARADKEAVEALTAPTAVKAYDTCCYEWFFITVGSIALVNSMKANSAIMASSLLEYMCGEDERELGKTVESVQARILSLAEIEELTRQRSAWLLALKALDEEAGLACLASLKHIAGDSVERRLKEGKGVDYSPELEYLREFWNVFTGEESKQLLL